MESRKPILGIRWIEWQMRAFEDKYGLASRDFYEAMESGQLSEFNDTEGDRFQDFLEWHGLCKMRLKRERSDPE